MKYMTLAVWVVSMIFTISGYAQEITEDFQLDLGSVSDLAWNSTGEFIVVGNSEAIRIIDVDKQLVVSSIPTTSRSIALSPDDTQIASYNLAENVISIFDFQSGELQKTIDGIPELFEIDGFIFENNLFWNSCGLFSINGTSGLFVWGESEYLPMPLILSGNNDVVLETLMTEDCETVITSSTDRITRVWSLASSEVVTSLEGGRAFAIRGDAITYISPENNIFEYTLSQPGDSQILYELDADEQISSLDWSHDNDILAYTTSHEVKILPLSSDVSITVHTSSDYIDKVRWHPSKLLLAIVDSSGTMSLLNLESIMIGH